MSEDRRDVLDQAAEVLLTAALASLDGDDEGTLLVIRGVDPSALASASIPILSMLAERAEGGRDLLVSLLDEVRSSSS